MYRKSATNAKYDSPDWIGQKFKMLTVVGIERRRNKRGTSELWWKVRCDCGNVKSMKAQYVASGHNRSCGCFRESGGFMTNMRHGETHTRLHNVWCGIKERCLTRSVFPERYHDRGITICDEWLEYENFAKWARENGYKDTLTIERIDNDGNYCPDNCKWIERKLQARNRETTHWVEWGGRKMSLAEACEIEGMPYKQVFARIKYCGWPLDKALTTPIQRVGQFNHRRGSRVYENF